MRIVSILFLHCVVSSLEIGPQLGQPSPPADTDIDISPEKISVESIPSKETDCNAGRVSTGDTIVVDFSLHLELRYQLVDGGKQQEFEVADGSLVPGFIEGVQGMCVREHRTITVPPSLGYGSKGLKKVPPDTTIIFEVFLVSVKKASDIKLMKDFENAVLNGDTEFLKEALPNHNLVNSKNVDKRTPLLTASFLGHDEIVTLLLANGADVTATDPSGITSVHYAAGMGHTGILDELLESGGNLNAKITTGTLKGYTPLHFACLNLKAGSVELLLGRNPRIRKAKDGKTPQDAAFEQGKTVKRPSKKWGEYLKIESTFKLFDEAKAKAARDENEAMEAEAAEKEEL